MTDAQRDRATARIRALLADRPDLQPTVETLYAVAWLETLTLLAALDQDPRPARASGGQRGGSPLEPRLSEGESAESASATPPDAADSPSHNGDPTGKHSPWPPEATFAGEVA